MALNLEDINWDFIRQAFLLTVAIILFFLVVARASSDQFYARYYAQDHGLIVETLHSVPNGAEVSYEKIGVQHAFDYDFAANNVRLRTAGTSDDDWRVRKRYGADQTTSTPVIVKTVLLADPGSIMYTLVDKQLSMTTTPRFDDTTCPPPPEKPLRAATILLVNDQAGALTTEEEASLRERFTPSLPPTTNVRLQLVTGERATLATSGDPVLGRALACRVHERLAETSIDWNEIVTPERALPAPTVTITIALPAEGLPGLSGTSITTAFTTALLGVTR